MRHLLIIILLFAFLACGKKESKAPASETSPSAPQMKKMDSANRELADAEDEIAEAPADKGKLKQEVKEAVEKKIDQLVEKLTFRLRVNSKKKIQVDNLNELENSKLGQKQKLCIWY